MMVFKGKRGYIKTICAEKEWKMIKKKMKECGRSD